MRVAVVGASGNIGTSVLRRLPDDVEVVGLSRRVPPDVEPYDRVVHWQTVDVSSDDALPVLREAFAGVDAVVHLAWAFQPTRHPDYLEQVGPRGTARVVTALLDAGVRRLVHMSSVGAYAPRTSLARVDESWPATGVPSSWYSRHKAAAEALLDRTEAEHPALVVTRLRPGFVLKAEAGAALGRYGLPAWLPRGVLTSLPLVTLPTGLALPGVHSDDVADAVARAVAGPGASARGAFNLQAEPVLDAHDVARALGGRPVPVPAALARAVVTASWHAMVQPIDAGWFDLAMQVPMLDSSRAERVLGWTPTVDAREAFTAAVRGIAAGDGVAGRVLGPRRSTADAVHTFVRSGPISRRTRP